MFHRIALARRGGDLSHFEARMRQLRIDDRIGAEVVGFLRKWNGIEDYEVRPDDDLIAVYSLADEDLLAAIAEIGQRCGRSPLTEPPQLRGSHLVEDLAVFVTKAKSI